MDVVVAWDVVLFVDVANVVNVMHCKNLEHSRNHEVSSCSPSFNSSSRRILRVLLMSKFQICAHARFSNNHGPKTPEETQELDETS